MEGKESISELLDAEIHMYPLILDRCQTCTFDGPDKLFFLCYMPMKTVLGLVVRSVTA